MASSSMTSQDSLNRPVSRRYNPSAAISGSSMAWNCPMVRTLEKPLSRTLGFNSRSPLTKAAR